MVVVVDEDVVDEDVVDEDVVDEDVVEVLTVIDRALDATDVFPVESVALAVMVWLPSAKEGVVNDQEPVDVAVAKPS